MLVNNQALGFHEGDQATERINKHSLLETVTGNFNSLMSRENSLFFLGPDDPPTLAKCSELCRMPCSVMREREPKPQKFPVKFPVSRELQRESGSLETASTAIPYLKPLNINVIV